jgi:hypothetical protein
VSGYDARQGLDLGWGPTAEHDTDRLFSGSIPLLYETLLVPLIFEPYARDLAKTLAALPLTVDGKIQAHVVGVTK